MRTLPVFVVSALMVCSAAASLGAQEPADTTVADSTALSPGTAASDDSLSATDSFAAEDSLPPDDSIIPRRPSRRAHGGNPYLREVSEPRRSLRRGPVYAGFGLGFGSEAIATLGVPAPYSSGRTRPTLEFSLGATVNQSLRLGLDGFAWFNFPGDGSLESVSALLLGARFYPFAENGLYLRAAGGVGRYGRDNLGDNCGCSGPIVEQVGFAYALGGGFEVPVGRGVSFGPSVEVVRMNIDGPDGYRERVINFGFTVTFDGKD